MNTQNTMNAYIRSARIPPMPFRASRFMKNTIIFPIPLGPICIGPRLGLCATSYNGSEFVQDSILGLYDDGAIGRYADFLVHCARRFRDFRNGWDGRENGSLGIGCFGRLAQAVV